MPDEMAIRALRTICDLQEERDRALRKAGDYAEASRICNLQNEEKRDRIRRLGRQFSEAEAVLREIRNDLGGLYDHLELPAAVREMLSTSRGIRDDRIAERDRRIERLAEQLETSTRGWEEALDERDRARASAIEWANAPIQSLFTAYNERRVRGMAQPGSLRNLIVEHGVESWTVSWSRAIVPGWEVEVTSGESLDEACTAAAEQIEAT